MHIKNKFSQKFYTHNSTYQTIMRHIASIDDNSNQITNKKRLNINLLIASWASTDYSISCAIPLAQQCLQINVPELGCKVLQNSKGDQDLDSSLLMGTCHLRMGNFKEAQQSVAAFVTEECTRYEAIAFLADVALAQQQLNTSINLLKQALTLGDTRVRTARLYSSLLFECGFILQAQAVVQSFLQQNREDNSIQPIAKLISECESARSNLKKYNIFYKPEQHDSHKIVHVWGCSVAHLQTSNPAKILQYGTKNIRTVWDLTSTPLKDLNQWDAELLTMAVAEAGAIICSPRQAHFIEERTAISITPQLPQKTAVEIAARAVAVGIGAGLGNMCKSKPLIQRLAEHLGHPVDVICNPSVPGSEVILTPNPSVAKAYGKLPLAVLKRYDMVFCTYHMGNCIPPFTARKTYVQMRHHPLSPFTRFTPEVQWNFKGVEDAFPGLSIPGATEYCYGNIGSEYYFPNNNIVGICDSAKGGAWGNRRWPHFHELAEILKGKGFIVRSLGTRNEFIPGTEDATSASLRQSVEGLKKCSFVIASDGGLVQLADSLGIPTITLFGPAGIIKNGPIHPFSRIITSSLTCSPCYWEKDFWTCTQARCMRAISVEKVLEVFNELTQETQRNFYLGPKLSAPSSTVALFEKETIHFLDQFSYTLSPDILSNNTFNEDVALCMVNGWLRLGAPEQAKAVLALYQKISSVELLKQKSYVERILGNRSEEITAYHAILEKEATATFHALKLADVYRRGREWDKFFALIDKILRRYPDESDALFEKGRALLEYDHRDEAKFVFSKVAQQQPQRRDEISNILDTTLFRHRSRRACIDVLSKAKIAVLLAKDDTVPDCFREIAAYGYLYYYYPEEILCFKTDAHWFDLVLTSPTFEAGDAFLTHCNCEHITYTQKLGEWLTTFKDILSRKKFAPRAAKRILLVAHHHLYRFAPHGGEFSQRQIAQYLQNNGYEIIILVPNRKNTELFCEMYEGLPFIVGSYINPLDLLRWGYAGYFPDLIQLYGTSSLAMTSLLQQLNIPYMVFVRYWSAVSHPPYIQGKDTKLDIRDRYFFEPLYSNAAAVIGNAEYTSAVVEQAFNIACDTVYAPVDPPQCPPVLPAHKRKYVTLINPTRGGGQFILRSLALLMPDVSFQVYQKPTLPLPKNVIIHPYHHGDYGEMFHDTRVLIVPSSEANCGIPRVVSEAYYCKTPVIAEDSGAVSELVPSRFLVPAGASILKWAQLVREAYNRILTENDFLDMERALDKIDVDKQLDRVLEKVKFLLP